MTTNKPDAIVYEITNRAIALGALRERTGNSAHVDDELLRLQSELITTLKQPATIDEAAVERVAEMLGAGFFGEHAESWEPEYAIEKQNAYRKQARAALTAANYKIEEKA